VRAGGPVRPPLPDGQGARYADASGTRPAPTAGGARHHGGGLPAVRPPLPHRHGAGQVVAVATAHAALPELGQKPGQASFAQLGEGPNLPGRQALAGDLQRRRARQPPPSQDAENDLPGKDPVNPGGPLGPRSPAGTSSRGTLGYERGATHGPKTLTIPTSLLQSHEVDHYLVPRLLTPALVLFRFNPPVA